MPRLVLKKVDSDFSIDFDFGNHVIGRGPQLLCESKKVSRNHGMLRVEGSGVFLHAIHNNPCFFQSCDTREIRIIYYGTCAQIFNDDKIAMSLDHGWFQAQVTGPSIDVFKVRSRPTDLVSNSVKRGIVVDNEKESDLESEESAAKKTKTNRNDTAAPCNENNIANNEVEREIKIEPVEENDNNELPGPLNLGDEQIVVKKEPVSNEDIVASKLLKVKEEKVDDDGTKADDGAPKSVEEEKNEDDGKKTDDGKKIDDDKQTSDGKKTDDDKQTNDGKKTNDGNTNDNQPSTSGSANKVWKDRCWYGSSCYRKNFTHRAQFRHPGDADYDSDASDTRPICCYGKDCYRKNKEHRKRLRHSGQETLAKQPPPPPKKKRGTPKPKPTKNTGTTTTTGSDLDDDYDYSDPFINDGDSSDEYQPEASDTESDYEESSQSQNVDEDIKQLQKDARKFTRRK